MTIDIGSVIDARMVRYLRNRTMWPDALFYDSTLTYHHTGAHFEAHHDDVDTPVHCVQLVSTGDCHNLYLKHHDDITVATLVRARVVVAMPDMFYDSKRAQRRQVAAHAAMAQESDAVRRYMIYGKAHHDSRAADRSGSSRINPDHRPRHRAVDDSQPTF